MSVPAAQVRDPQTYALIGARMEVHREMGSGFLEHAYHDALRIELGLRAIEFGHEVKLPIYYKGHKLTCEYCADFVCFGSVIVEVKAIKQLTDVDRAEVINYLRATGLTRALLVNFGARSLEFERIVLDPHHAPSSSA